MTSRVTIDGGVARVELSRGLFALIDTEDAERVGKHRWYADPHGKTFTVRRSDGVRLHRFLLDNPDSEIDHINRDCLDNRKANLRLATRVQNGINRGPHGGTSRFKGVSWNPKREKWETSIGFKSRMVWLGYFDEEDDAAIAYNAAAQILHGSFAFLNNV